MPIAKRSKRIPKYRLHKASGRAIVTLAGEGRYEHDRSSDTRNQMRPPLDRVGIGVCQ